MTEKRLKWFWWTILGVYLASFAVPMDGKPGALLFMVAFLVGLHLPGYLLLWMANPLLWWGLREFRRERWDRVAVIGSTASFLAGLLLVPREGWQSFGARNLDAPPAFWVWYASMVLLALSGWVGWTFRAIATRAPLRIRDLMIVVAVIAILTALFRSLPWLMNIPGIFLPRSGGFYVG